MTRPDEKGPSESVGDDGQTVQELCERTPHYASGLVTLYAGDCIEVMRGLPDASVDAVVTDPPYGLEFMGREWDGADGFRRSLNAADVGRDNAFGRASRTSPEYNTGRGVRVAEERASEMTPSGVGHSTSAGPYLAARVDSIRVAGIPFQAWCQAWASEALRVLKPGGHLLAFGGTRTWHRLACAVEDSGFEMRDSIAWLYGSGFPKSLNVAKAITGTPLDVDDNAKRWEGWGTALKPGHEPIVVARKPLTGTVAANVTEHGTGALNVDACRIATPDRFGGGGSTNGSPFDARYELGSGFREGNPLGRWPANVVLDESQAAELDKQSGTLTSGKVGPEGFTGPHKAEIYGTFARNELRPETVYGDSGGASRFFYCAKAPTDERPRDGDTAHPTVKPLDLMRWLVRLVTPPDGTVLEPFAGSGTTAEACVIEGFRCIAIEREPSYLPLIVARLSKPIQPSMFGGAA